MGYCDGRARVVSQSLGRGVWGLRHHDRQPYQDPMESDEGNSAVPDKEQRDAKQAKPTLQKPLHEV